MENQLTKDLTQSRQKISCTTLNVSLQHEIVWNAECEPTFQLMDEITARVTLKAGILKILALYNSQVAEQFETTEEQTIFISTLLDYLRKYHQQITPSSFVLAFEYNLAGKWDKIQRYGKISTEFISSVLSAYEQFKGKMIVEVRGLLEPRKSLIDEENMKDHLMQMIEDDRLSLISNQKFELRLPEIYYHYLVENGRIEETDEMVADYQAKAKIEYVKLETRKREEMSLAGHRMDKIRIKDWLAANHQTKKTRILNLAKTLAVRDYLLSI